MSGYSAKWLTLSHINQNKIIMDTVKKITLATVKSFLNKNRKNLHIRCDSTFSGMSDMVEQNVGAEFKAATIDNGNVDHNFGIEGAWFVGQSRDYFKSFENESYMGFEIYNACGSFILAIKKSEAINEISSPIDLPAAGKIATCKLNTERGGIELYFPGKPGASVLADLKANGFRWSRFNSCWYKLDNAVARKVAAQYAEIPQSLNATERLQDAVMVDAQEQAAIAIGNY